MQFDWKALEKSMDAVDKAVTTYEHADHSTNNELDAFRVYWNIYPWNNQ